MRVYSGQQCSNQATETVIKRLEFKILVISFMQRHEEVDQTVLNKRKVQNHSKIYSFQSEYGITNIKQ